MKMIQRTVAVTSAAALAALIAASCRDRDQEGTPPPKSATPYAGPAVRLRDEGFRVEWVSNTMPATMKAGTSRDVDVTFKNVSGLTWPDPGSTGSDPSVYGAVRLAYRWHSMAPPIYAGEFSRRVDLARPLGPGETTTLRLTVTAPAAPGEYRLQFDLIQEMASWFEKKGATRLLIPVRIE